ncbi:MAG TPA: hypothetical protein VGP93_04390 [Polyangiaceae bacterium]|nr:hypothetical protein [Polyangiaceae bacterium]
MRAFFALGVLPCAWYSLCDQVLGQLGLAAPPRGTFSLAIVTRPLAMAAWWGLLASGPTAFALQLARDRHPAMSALIPRWRLTIPILIAACSTSLMIGLPRLAAEGLAQRSSAIVGNGIRTLLIVFSFPLIVRTITWIPLIVDRGVYAQRGLRLSWEQSRGRGWRLATLSLVVLPFLVPIAIFHRSPLAMKVIQSCISTMTMLCSCRAYLALSSSTISETRGGEPEGSHRVKSAT